MDSRRGWIVVAAGFIAGVVVLGITFSFGVMFNAMAEEFGAGKGATAGMFSLTNALLFSLGLVTGPIADKHGARPLLLTGAAVMATGLLLTAFVDSLWLGYLTYGVGVGVGGACTYVPMMSAVSGWFEHRRTTALSLMVTGAGVGTTVVAPLSAWLVDTAGLRATCMLFALAVAVTLPLCAAVTNRAPRSGAPPSVARPPRQVVADRSFVLLYVASAGLTTSLFAAFVFLAPFAANHGAGSGQAAALVSVLGGASVVGRLAIAFRGNRGDALGLYRLAYLAIGLSLGLWLVGNGSFETLLAFAAVFGLAYGGWVALSAVVATSMFGGVNPGRLLGALYTSSAVGALIGPPVAGIVIDGTGSYLAAIALAMALALSAWALLGQLQLRPVEQRATTTTTRPRPGGGEPVARTVRVER